jgi:hypothetical protein
MIHMNDALELVQIYRELYYFNLVYPGTLVDVTVTPPTVGTYNGITVYFTFVEMAENIERMRRLYSRGAFREYIGFAHYDIVKYPPEMVLSYRTNNNDCVNVLRSCNPGQGWDDGYYADRYLRNMYHYFQRWQLGHTVPRPDDEVMGHCAVLRGGYPNHSIIGEEAP